MKLISVFVLAALLALASAIPWKAQIALANSLEVGRNEDPTTWSCVGCNADNQPLTTVIIEEKAKDVKSTLAVYEEYTVLAFRYTNTIKNVGQDLLWAIQGAKVQRAMDRMWNSIRDDVLAGLRQSVHTGRLIITGISLGGALTCLSYVDIAASGIFDEVELITFGAPRVGNRKWASWFDSITRSDRYYIKADPIASLPICFTLICNYKQTGTPIVCNKNTETCTVKSVSEEEEEMTPAQYFSALAEAANDHIQEDDDNVDGILDHIYGYKKIYNYTLVG